MRLTPVEQGIIDSHLPLVMECKRLREENEKLVAFKRRVDEALSRVIDWTHQCGRSLCPTAGSADTFGDGMREAQRQVANLIALRPTDAAGSAGVEP